MNRKSIVARLIATLLMVGLSLPSMVFADPQKAAEYYQQATEAYQNGDLESAADLLNKAYAEDPDLVYQYNRILALQGLGKYEEALQVASALEAPMKADPQNRFEDIAEIKAQLQAQVEKQRQAQTDTTTTDATTANNNTDTTVEDQTTIQPEPSGPPILAYALLGAGGALLVPGVLFVTGILMPSDAADCLGIGGSAQGDACEAFAEARGAEPSVETGTSEAKDVQKLHAALAIAFLTTGVLTAAAGAIVLALSGGGGSAALPVEEPGAFTVAPYVAGDGGGAVIQFRF